MTLPVRARGPKPCSEAQLIRALAIAPEVGTKCAAREVGIGERTVERYQTAVLRGLEPDLARAVRKERERWQHENADPALSTAKAVYARVKELAPKMNIAEAVNAMRQIADILIEREYVNRSTGQEVPQAGAAGGTTQIQIVNNPNEGSVKASSITTSGRASTTDLE